MHALHRDGHYCTRMWYHKNRCHTAWHTLQKNQRQFSANRKRRVVPLWPMYRHTLHTSWPVVSVIVWTMIVCFSRHWLAADNLCMIGWISKCRRVCANYQLLSQWLIKPHMTRLVTAGYTFMDVPPPHAKTPIDYLMLASFMHCGPSPAHSSITLAICIISHCVFASGANYSTCCAVWVRGTIE